MGKVSRWFRGVLGLRKPDSSSCQLTPSNSKPPAKEKRRWNLVRSYREKERHHQQRHQCASGDSNTTVSENGSRGDVASEIVDPNKHAIAVAVTTTAAAEADTAVVRLTRGGRCTDTVTEKLAFGSGSIGVREEWAAVKIQASFRRCLARKALRALKGLVKLQALIRGNIERKRTAEWLYRMQAVIRAQTLARVERIQNFESSYASDKSCHSHHPGPATPEKFEHAIRSRSMKYDHSLMLKRNGSKSHGKVIGNQEKFWNRLGLGLDENSQNEQRASIRTSDLDDIRGEKVVQNDPAKHQLESNGRHFSKSTHIYIVNDRHDNSFNTSKDSISHQSVPSTSCCEVQSFSPFKHGDEIVESPLYTTESTQFLSSSSIGASSKRSPFNPAKSDGSRSYFSGYSDYPNYMSCTESSKAKVRSLSAPRQRSHYERSSSSKRFEGSKFKRYETMESAAKSFALSESKIYSHEKLLQQLSEIDEDGGWRQPLGPEDGLDLVNFYFDGKFPPELTDILRSPIAKEMIWSRNRNAAISFRLSPGVWKYLYCDLKKWICEESPEKYLEMEGQQILYRRPEYTYPHLTLDFNRYASYLPYPTLSKYIGNGMEFLNCHLCSKVLNKKENMLLLFEFLRSLNYKGEKLMLCENIHSFDALLCALRKAEDHLRSLPANTAYSEFDAKLREFGLAKGWGNTARRVLDTMHLLLELFEAPEPSILEMFLERIPLVFNVVFLHPQGHTDQTDGMTSTIPNWGNSLTHRYVTERDLFDLDQVRALETEMLSRLEEQGLNITPRILIFTSLLPDAEGNNFNQRVQQVYGTKHADIIRVPFREKEGPLLRKQINKFEFWPFLETYVEDVAKEIVEELEGKPDLIVGNFSDGNLVATLLARKFGVTQCRNAPVGNIPIENWKEEIDPWEDPLNLSCQFTADLISMNSADFIIARSFYEIAGNKDTCGHYEIRSCYNHPDLYSVVHGIEASDPRFNVVPPGSDPSVFFPYSEEKRRSKDLRQEIEDLLYKSADNEATAALKEQYKPIILSMAPMVNRFISFMVEWYGSYPRLRELANLVIVGQTKAHDFWGNDINGLIERLKLKGQVRWISSPMKKEKVGELLRMVADSQGVSVCPPNDGRDGMLVLEAMSCGVPTFSVSNAEPAEIIVHGSSGFFIDPQEAEEEVVYTIDLEEEQKELPEEENKVAEILVDFFEKCREEQNHWFKISMGGLRRIQEKFTWKTNSQKVLKLTAAYSFWKNLSKDEQHERNCYIDMVYHLVYRPEVEKVLLAADKEDTPNPNEHCNGKIVEKEMPSNPTKEDNEDYEDKVNKGKRFLEEDYTLHLDFKRCATSIPHLTLSKNIGNGMDFLSRHLCTKVLNRKEKMLPLTLFLVGLNFKGTKLMLGENIHDSDALLSALRKAQEYLRSLPGDIMHFNFDSQLQEFGVAKGWGNTAERVIETMDLLLNLFEVPNPSTFQMFFERIPLVFNVVILNPQGHFAQNHDLVVPETNETIELLTWLEMTERPVFDLDQVRALEKEMLARFDEQGLDITPRILIFSRRVPESGSSDGDKSVEKVDGTQHTDIIRIPFKINKNDVVEKHVTKFDVWSYLEKFVEDVEVEIYTELQGKPDLIIGNFSDGNIVATLLAKRFGVTQCTNAPFEDMRRSWDCNAKQLNLSCQYTADLISMNSSDFIIASSLSEIVGNEENPGPYKKRSCYNHPGLYNVVNGIDILDPRFNIVPPGVDDRVYFPHTDEKRRSPELQQELENLLFGPLENDEKMVLTDRSKPIIFAMTHVLHSCTNIPSLVDWYKSNSRLRELANLVILAETKDTENYDFRSREKMLKHSEEQDLKGQFRWLNCWMKREKIGELLRLVADTKGIFIHPPYEGGDGMSILEAMSCGVIPFATDNEAPAEIIVDGKSGFQINPAEGCGVGNVMANFFERCQQEPDYWEKISAGCLRRIQHKYNWNLYSERLLDLTAFYTFWKQLSKDQQREKGRYNNLVYDLVYRRQVKPVGTTNKCETESDDDDDGWLNLDSRSKSNMSD